MRLAANVVADHANVLARAFGLKSPSGEALVVAEPRDEAARQRVFVQMAVALGNVRPTPLAPAVGEVVSALADVHRRSGGSSTWPVQKASPRFVREGVKALRRELAELDQLVAQSAYGRAKRAERARILPLLLVFFDLERVVGPSLGTLATATPDEFEERLRLVRRAMDEILRDR